MKNTLLVLAFVAALHVGTTTAAEYTVPFGLATAPGSRLVISDVFDTAAGDQEESIARFGTKASRLNVIAFYTEALEGAGFEIYSSSDNADFAMIAAKREDDRITVYYKMKSDWVEPDENEISIKAVYKK